MGLSLQCVSVYNLSMLQMRRKFVFSGLYFQNVLNRRRGTSPPHPSPPVPPPHTCIYVDLCLLSVTCTMCFCFCYMLYNMCITFTKIPHSLLSNLWVPLGHFLGVGRKKYHPHQPRPLRHIPATTEKKYSTSHFFINLQKCSHTHWA